MQSWAFEHSVSLILAYMALFDLKLIQDELILLLDHKKVLIIIQVILQNL